MSDRNLEVGNFYAGACGTFRGVLLTLRNEINVGSRQGSVDLAFAAKLRHQIGKALATVDADAKRHHIKDWEIGPHD